MTEGLSCPAMNDNEYNEGSAGQLLACSTMASAHGQTANSQSENGLTSLTDAQKALWSRATCAHVQANH